MTRRDPRSREDSPGVPILGNDGRARIELALAELGEGADGLAAAEALRRALPPELSRAATELRELRRRAAPRFERAERMWFTPRGLEQASRGAVAERRAARIEELGGGRVVVDATAGIGADALALARRGLLAAAVERDRRTALCARWNLEASGLPARVVRADATRPAVRAPLVLVDPDRRAEGGRSLDPERWSPAWPAVLALLEGAEGGCVKLPPGLDPEALELPEDRPSGLEWLSFGGKLAELTLWTGALAPQDGAPRSAVRMRPDGSEVCLAGSPAAAPVLGHEEAEAAAWIAEPDPAVVRAGLLGALSGALGLRALGARLAWLGGAEPPSEDPTLGLVRVRRVLDRAKADPRHVRRMLARHDVGEVAVTRRGHPDAPEVLARRFRGKGTRRGDLLVGRLERGHLAWLVEGTDGSMS
jgi:hypothetical protein